MPLHRQLVSYSELKTHTECSYRHYLEYDLDKKQDATVWTVYGNSLHEAIDRNVGGNKLSWITFGKTFLRWVRKNSVDPKVCPDPKQWIRCGFQLYHEVFSWIDKEFDYPEILETEMRLEVPITKYPDWIFKGFIDLVLKTKDGMVHICDLKTSKEGWHLKKKTDELVQKQLCVYKLFYCKLKNMDPNLVKTHFIILKREPKPGEERIEKLPIASSAVKMRNCEEWVDQKIGQMINQKKLKNKLSCRFCQFKNTPDCP